MLSDNAEKIFRMKYSREGEETWEQACWRVATYVASAEEDLEKRREYEKKFFELIYNLVFIPGGRILANAGTGISNLMNCISGDTAIYTKELGLITMQDVVPGMHVLTHTGQFKTVLKHWSNGEKNISYYHRGHANGKAESIGATDDHLVLDGLGKWSKISGVDYVTPPVLLDSGESFPPQFHVPDNIVINNVSRFSNMIDNTDDFAFILGLYLAEGGISTNRVYFTLGGDEVSLVEKLKNSIKAVFNIEPKVRTYVNRNWVNVDINSKQIAELFLQVIGKGFDNKRIPLWVFSGSDQYKKSFLSGILNGDAHYFVNDTSRLVLANPTLVYECVLLARSCGEENVTFKLFAENKLSKSRTSMMHISNSPYVNRLISVRDCVDEVFDMEVEDDHSFVAGDTVCHNCFVLPVDDSRLGIYDALKNAAEVFAAGGGVGYNFSELREEGAEVTSTGGKASGPISFMSLFDQTGEVISQASRRGAQLAALDIDHPDVVKFINHKSTPDHKNARILEEYKRNLKRAKLNSDGDKYFQVLEKTIQDDQLSHFNISVLIDDAFMLLANEDGDWSLISRKTNEPIYTLKAKELLHLIAQRAWESGDPK